MIRRAVEAGPRERTLQARSIFINRNYGLFMAGSFVGATGSWIQGVAMGWLALELGNSAFVLGLVGFARMVPLLLIAFPVGALGDRLDRRKMLIASNLGSFAAALALTLSVWAGLASVPLLVGLALAAGTADAFGWPVWSVFIKDMVGPERLRTAVAVNSARFNLTRVIGPSIGGLLLAAYGPALCFSVSTLMALGVLVALLLIRLAPREQGEHGPWLPALGEGLRFAAGTPDVRRILLVTAGMGLFGQPYQQMLPAIARDGLGVGPEGLGLLMTSVGAGAIVGAVMTGAARAQRRARPLLVLLPVGVGLALVVIGLAPLVGGMPLATAALAVVGLCSIAHMAVANTTLQLGVRESIVGRVMGLFTVVQAGMMPLGSLGLGALADRAGLTLALGVAGLGAAAVALCVGWAWLSPAAEGEERHADAEQKQRPGQVDRPLEVARPARQPDRGLQQTGRDAERPDREHEPASRAAQRPDPHR
jgi:MFS family permease